MDWDFESELIGELEKLTYFYDFCYFNNALPEEEIKVIEKLIKSHRSVIKVLGGK